MQRLITYSVILFALIASVDALSGSLPLIGATNASKLNLTGIGQTICVIDSGIDYTHPDLGGCTREQFLAGNCSKIIGGYAFYDNISSDRNDIMDNLWHGTHVTGIIAANGKMRGIAPDAKIVGLKACDAETMGCNEQALLDSVNWCLHNASRFNISIISMSLGYGLYDSKEECNDLNSGFTRAFAEARARGIPVITATQNNGSSSRIAYPACMSNVTAVGATDKNDIIAEYGDRGNLLTLVAPGTQIGSLVLNEKYGERSGTSMAVPHVSGSVALIKQYFTEQNRNISVEEIENILNKTGKPIYDPSSSKTYSRINVYEALLELDFVGPKIEKIIHRDAYVIDNKFWINVSVSDWQLNRIIFVMKNDSEIILTKEENISGRNNKSDILLENLSVGKYNWTLEVFDKKNNSNSISGEFIFGQIEENKTWDDRINSNASLDYTNNTNSSQINNTENSSENNSSNQINNTNNESNSIFSNQSVQNSQTTNNITNNSDDKINTSSYSSSSSEGSGGIAIYRINEGQLEEGYTRWLGKGDRIQFNFIGENGSNERYTLIIDKIWLDTINFSVNNIYNAVGLSVGREAMLNLSSSEHYNVIVKLKSVTNNEAQVKIIKANTPIIENKEEVKGRQVNVWSNINSSNESYAKNGERTINSSINSKINKDVIYYPAVILVSVSILALIMYWIDMKGRNVKITRKRVG